jgi:hypothetical protein
MIEPFAARATRFRPSILWAFVMLLVFMTLVLTGVWLSLNLLFGTRYSLDWDLFYPVLAGAVGGAAGSWHAQRRRWVTVSAAGIELAQHGVPILVEWRNVASAAVRRWGPFAVLEVIPVELHQVRALAPGSQVPPVQRLAGGPGFRLDVGMLWPVPSALRAALKSGR